MAKTNKMNKGRLIERMQITRRMKEAASFIDDDNNLNRLPIVYGNDDYMLTKDSMWVGFHIPHKNTGFLSTNQRKDQFDGANEWFTNFPSDEENSGHLLIVNHTQTSEEWERRLLEKERLLADEEGRELPEGFAPYIGLARKAIDTREFFRRDIFLFVKTNDRSDWKGGVKGFLETLARLMTSGFGIDDSQPLGEEKAINEERSDQVRAQFQKSWVNATPVYRSRVEWLVRYLDSLGSPTPDVAPVDEIEWGIGRWQTTMSSWTRRVDLGKDSENNRIRGIEFVTTTGEGISYACMMPISVTPNYIQPFSNWLFTPSTLPFPVDCSLHFEVIDPTRTEKELDKPLDAAEAQAMEEQEADRKLDEATQQQRQQLEGVKTSTIRERKPMVNWQCVFMVYDTDKEELKKKTRELRSHFEGHQMRLEVPPGDQRTLFYQSFPGAEITVKDWVQRSNTNALAASMPWLETVVGSDIEDKPALYQGYTVIADGKEVKHGTPMFFDLASVADEEGRAPTEFVCGDPGSGKTVSRGLKPVHENALKGITQFVWDPKGDFEPIYKYAPQLLLDQEKIKLITLGSSGENDIGISLDAFAIAEHDEEHDIDDRISTGIDVFRGLSQSLQYNHKEQIITDAVRLTVQAADRDERQPKMTDVISTLERWKDGDFNEEPDLAQRGEDMLNEYANFAYSLNAQLETVRKNSLGRILFRDPERGTLKVETGTTTIFNALNLKEVEPDADRAEEGVDVAISRVIQEMMTSYIRSLLSRLDDTVTKAVFFDEWHVIRRGRAAERLLDWLKRMGRSKRTSVTYLSQSANDSGGGTLNSVWCGKCETDENAIASCKLLGIEVNDYNIKTLRNLIAGEFIYRDPAGKVARMSVDFWDSDVLDLFNTQARAKATNAAKAREKEKAELDEDENEEGLSDAMRNLTELLNS